MLPEFIPRECYRRSPVSLWKVFLGSAHRLRSGFLLAAALRFPCRRTFPNFLPLRLLLSSFLFSGHRRSLPPSHVHHESGLHTTSRCIDSNDRHAAAKAFPSKQEPYCFGGRSHEVRTVGAPRTRLPSTCRSACVDR